MYQVFVTEEIIFVKTFTNPIWYTYLSDTYSFLYSKINIWPKEKTIASNTIVSVDSRKKFFKSEQEMIEAVILNTDLLFTFSLESVASLVYTICSSIIIEYQI